MLYEDIDIFAIFEQGVSGISYQPALIQNWNVHVNEMYQ